MAATGTPCPRCKSPARTTVTKDLGDGVTRRNRLCERGHMFKTYEVSAGFYRNAMKQKYRIQSLEGVVRTSLE